MFSRKYTNTKDSFHNTKQFFNTDTEGKATVRTLQDLTVALAEGSPVPFLLGTKAITTRCSSYVGFEPRAFRLQVQCSNR